MIQKAVRLWQLRMWRASQLARTGYYILRQHGVGEFQRRLKSWFAGERTYFFSKYDFIDEEVEQITYSELRPPFTRYPVAERNYRHHIKRIEPDALALAAQVEESDGWGDAPLLSILTPTFNVPQAILQATIESVLVQTYGHWEWIIVDASTDVAVWDYLQEVAATDDRIKCHRIDNSGISGNTNAALDFAQGEYVVLLDHDDTLRPFALFEVAQLIRERPEADLIYSDEDKLDRQEFRCEPFCKPQWSPETMLSANVITHLAVIRRELLSEIGGFDPEMDGAQDWDVFLRLSEKTSAIYHIPKVLYHWRKTPNSTAESIHHKPGIGKNQRKAIVNHLKRRGIVEPHVYADAKDPIHCVHPIIEWQPQTQHRVSIIIPSKDQAVLLGRLLDTLFASTQAVDFEVILVDTGSEQAATDALYARYADQLKLVRYQGEFNFSRACNLGAAHAQGDLLLFMNNDMEVVDADWLKAMVQWFDMPDVGVVGPKLLYPNRRLQHAGIILGMGGIAAHIFREKSENINSVIGAAKWYRNVTAVTGACLLIRRTLFEQVDGFDESYHLNYSDVDLCLKAREADYRIVYTPQSVLIHHESVTHVGRIPREDFLTISKRIQSYLSAGDPYYNPNLSHMFAMPTFKLGVHDTPQTLNDNLLAALPDKEYILLPDDLETVRKQYRG